MNGHSAQRNGAAIGRGLLSFCLACSHAVTAMSGGVAHATESIRINGEIKSSYELRDRTGPEAELDVKIRSKRVLGTRAVVKVEGRYFRESLFVKDVYIDHKAHERLKFQVGINKKRLGMEYEQSRKERLTPLRSFLYQELEELGLVGRQLNLRLIGKPIPGVRTTMALGRAASRDTNLLLHIGYEQNDFGVSYWGLAEWHRINKDYILVWANAVAAYYISDTFRAVAEVIGGTDAVATESERLFGRARDVVFVGPKVELARRFAAGDSLIIEPLVQSGLLFRDVRRGGQSSVQVLGGVNIRQDAAILAFTVEYLGHSGWRKPLPYSQQTRWPRTYVEFKHRF